MQRTDIVSLIGKKYHTYTIMTEKGEFSYKSEFEKIGKNWEEIRIKNPYKKEKDSYYQDLDIRFVNKEKKITICVETKVDFKKSKKLKEKAKNQLQAYIEYEKKYSGNKIIGIIASTAYDEVLIYEDDVEDSKLMNFTSIPTMEFLIDYLFPKNINNKENVINATYRLNEMLYSMGIEAKIRGQFVGTCLLAIKNGLKYESLLKDSTKSNTLITEIENIISNLIGDSEKKDKKIKLLNKNVLENEKVLKLSNTHLDEVLSHIDKKILPFINDDTTAGQDILNIFFTMFNKYVDKDDKNQAFTPDHITDFMCKITGVDSKSRVLDPCCGSGSFLVRALVTARNSCTQNIDREKIIKRINVEQIYGIEYAEKPFGLSVTNMLIHGDGNSNILYENCFSQKKWIMETVKPTVILMNPPYNAQKIDFPTEIVEESEKEGQEKILKSYSSSSWGGNEVKTDPTKGLCFVEYMSDCVREAELPNVKLAVLVQPSCAIGNNSLLKRVKENLLEYNTLEAVFSLPTDIFYPGANTNACCMLFNLGEPHCDSNGNPKKKTFFGYYKDDGFRKKKNLGRIEKINDNNESIWEKEIKPKWLELFKNGEEELGLSVKQYVTYEDEWLAEAYMKTDYSTLKQEDFEKTIRDFIAYKIKFGVKND